RELEPAAAAGVIRWTGGGYVPNDQALACVRGATAGLSLLHDEPNYRHSLPTKVIEYMAHGVPVITTPLPAAAELVERYGCGVVVPFGDVDAVGRAVRDLHAQPDRREEMGRRGHEAARRDLSWQREGERFVALLRTWAR
ncbi:MAG TPA: glycosyltransferase, partial [Nitriliruptorales bacterium]